MRKKFKMSAGRMILLVLGILVLGSFDDGIVPGFVSEPILFRIIIDSIGLGLLIGSNYVDNRRFNMVVLAIEVLTAIGYLLCKYIYLNTHNIVILAVGIMILVCLSVCEVIFIKKYV